MKKTLAVIVAASTAFGALALDGTFAASNQYPDVQGNSVRYTIYDIDGTTPLAKAKGAAQFMIDGAVVGITASNPTGVYGFFLAGVFSAGAISIPDKAGQTVEITIGVWDKSWNGAKTYAEAAKGLHFLPAQTVTVRLGGDGNPPANPGYLVGFTGGKMIELIPEPSTYALATLGFGGLLYANRRK